MFTVYFTTYLKIMDKLQKKMLRVMAFSEYPLFYRLKLMTIKDLYEYSSGIYLYKSVHRVLPTIFWNEFTLCKTNRYPIIFNIYIFLRRYVNNL